MSPFITRVFVLFLLLASFALLLEAIPNRSRRVPDDQMQFLEDIVSDMMRDRKSIRPGK